MNLSVTVTDATKTATADWTFEPTLEATSQPVTVQWGDGTADFIAAGTLTQSHVYAKAGYFKVEAQSNEVRTHQHIRVGDPVAAASIQGGAYTRTQRAIREDVAGMAAMTTKLG